MKASKQLPSVGDMRRTMRRLSLILYNEWKRELRYRLFNLEFEGYIAKDHIDVPSIVWRLPNQEITYALNRLKKDLQELGYDYEFKLDNVNEITFDVIYNISLPDDCDEEETKDDDELLNEDNAALEELPDDISDNCSTLTTESYTNQ